jgi:glucosamine--fructose-6-phosphate aminotransferase (isomerizing)
MCGIIGYAGKQKALPFLIDGLKSLEYRGYDSCGIALIEKGKIKLVRAKGEVAQLVKKTRRLESQAVLGIGHTRWATHGQPSVKNAHPHVDCAGKVAVIHNGIIENFQDLKDELIKLGHKFRSDTDTEVFAHLIEEELKRGKDLVTAVKASLQKTAGTYGLGVICADFPDQIIIARQSSPLILGLGKKENFIASDQPALISWTKNLASLKDGQIAKITADKVEITRLDGQKGSYQKISVEKAQKPVSKSGYKHFLLKEIFEQDKVMESGLAGRFDIKKGVKLGGIEPYLKDFKNIDFLPIVACGTSYHAGLVAKHFFQKLVNLPTLVEDATDLAATDYPWPSGKPAIFVSQSGETADVLTVLRRAKKYGVATYGSVNVIGSSLARETKAGVYTRAGFEIGVASSKAFTAQMLAFLLWAILLGKADKPLLKNINNLPKLVKSMLKKSSSIKKLAKSLIKSEKIYLFGRGIGKALALEGALKIKELAYIPAEGMGAGELKHGPLALVDKDTVLIFLIPNDEALEKNLNAVHEARARGGRIIVLTNKKRVWEKGIKPVYFPACQPLLVGFPMAIWLQLLAYYMADLMGRSIDKPRNLAKSVTVE